MDEEIKTGDMFTHNETGAKCIVVAAGFMKVENSQWFDSVSYQNLEGQNPLRVFTRDATAFREKFTRISV